MSILDDLLEQCSVYGTVIDVFIPNKKPKAGKRFAFVRFIKVFNLDRLVKNLCTIWIGSYHLFANQVRCGVVLCERDFSNCAMGGVKSFEFLYSYNPFTSGRGIRDVTLSYLGACGLLKLIRDFVSDERVVWLDIEGVPLYAWSRKSFDKIYGNKWGEVLNIEDSYETYLWTLKKPVEEDFWNRVHLCHTPGVLARLTRNYDYVFSEEAVILVGILMDLEESFFKKDYVRSRFRLLAFYGTWIPCKTKLLVVSIYAPQQPSLRRVLWEYLLILLGRWNGEAILMGDYNEVQLWFVILVEHDFGRLGLIRTILNCFGVKRSFTRAQKLSVVDVNDKKIQCAQVLRTLIVSELRDIDDWMIWICPGKSQSQNRAIDGDDLEACMTRFVGTSCLTSLRLLDSVRLGVLGLEVPKGVLKVMESIRSNFFKGASMLEKKISGIAWDKVLASKKKGGLGVSSYFDDSFVVSCYPSGSWGWIRLIIIQFVSFWKETWIGDIPLCELCPRLFALDSAPNICVAAKMAGPLDTSFRRSVRGGVEQQEFSDLSSFLNSVVLSTSNDRWYFSLSSSGEFSVKDTRLAIDDLVLPSHSEPTRWVKLIPIKINVFMWRARRGCLPTRYNLVQKGVILESTSCPVCFSDEEDVHHLLFRCSLSQEVLHRVCRWWEIDFQLWRSFSEWDEWFSSIRLPGSVKGFLEGVFYVAWWFIWGFRNRSTFDVNKPSRSILFENIVSSSFLWCNSRCSRKFSRDDWLKNPHLISL
ncbi:RNA-directed DNA polymerase, eukaryota [Tanacetum coccineum]